MTDSRTADQGVDPNECCLASEMGMRMAEKFVREHGRIPKDEIEFAGMMGVAFMLGRESIAGRVR